MYIIMDPNTGQYFKSPGDGQPPRIDRAHRYTLLEANAMVERYPQVVMIDARSLQPVNPAAVPPIDPTGMVVITKNSGEFGDRQYYNGSTFIADWTKAKVLEYTEAKRLIGTGNYVLVDINKLKEEMEMSAKKKVPELTVEQIEKAKDAGALNRLTTVYAQGWIDRAKGLNNLLAEHIYRRAEALGYNRGLWQDQFADKAHGCIKDDVMRDLFHKETRHVFIRRTPEVKALRAFKKLNKPELNSDRVDSDNLHVGIELELIGEYDGDGHDDDACRESAKESYREHLESMGSESILRYEMGRTCDQARKELATFDRDAWIEHLMDRWHWNGCDGDCGFGGEGGSDEDRRDRLNDKLIALTKNASFKVVSDGSINTGDDGYDAEVCWNYYMSKDTIKDNARILAKLHDEGYRFNSSCGLHINLNNYLDVIPGEIPTKQIEYLFNFVADSRRESDYCNRMGVSSTAISNMKYSMIYHQEDRLEFRFFSPTLDAMKLHHYVVLANTVYKRLAGRPAKLPARTARYFTEKMQKVNKRSLTLARATIDSVNNMPSMKDLIELSKPDVARKRVEENEDNGPSLSERAVRFFRLPEAISTEAQAYVNQMYGRIAAQQSIPRFEPGTIITDSTDVETA